MNIHSSTLGHAYQLSPNFTVGASRANPDLSLSSYRSDNSSSEPDRTNSSPGFVYRPSASSSANSSRQSNDSLQALDIGENDFTNRAEQNANSQNRQQARRAIEAREQLEIQELAARDREVRAHEQAHAAVGGAYAGAPSYQYETGPDGVRYAIAGQVQIDTSKGSTPE